MKDLEHEEVITDKNEMKERIIKMMRGEKDKKFKSQFSNLLKKGAPVTKAELVVSE